MSCVLTSLIFRKIRSFYILVSAYYIHVHVHVHVYTLVHAYMHVQTVCVHTCNLLLVNIHVHVATYTCSSIANDHVHVHVYHYAITALLQAQSAYKEKVESARTPQNILLKLAWNVHELEELTSSVCQLIVDISSLKDKLADPQYDTVKENTARTLKLLRSRMAETVTKLSKHQRTAATHIFVVMVSPESRNRKPYALPVQCLPIRALRVQQVRDIVHKLIALMVERQMNVAGTCVCICICTCTCI